MKLLHTDLSRDVAVFGMIGIHITRQAYIARMRAMQSLMSSSSQRVGVLGEPVTANEIPDVFFDGSEWRDLESCDVGDCSLKLPGSIMHQFAQGVEWDGRNAQGEVDSLMRSVMQTLVTDYRAHGNPAMFRYDDTHGVLASDAFNALLDQSVVLRQYAPAFRDFLANYPANRPEGALDVMYWSVYQLPHLRHTFTLNQMLVYTTPTGLPLSARKQIYANHYFEASLGVSAVFDAPDLAGGPGIYLAIVRRYRFDNLPGGIFNVRGRVRNQLQKLLQADLERERLSSESGGAR